MAWEPGEVRFFEKSVVPTVDDDENDGFRVSDIWLNLTDDTSFRCLDSSVGAAIWKENLSELEADLNPELGGDLGGGGYNIDSVGKFCGCSLAATICNDTGATLVKGTAVTVCGLFEEKCCVCVSDNREQTKMPVCGIIEADIVDGDSGCGIIIGRVKMDTSGMTGVVGDRLYAQNDGSVDTVIPTSGMVQRVGFLTTKAAGNAGRICVCLRGPRSMYSAKDQHPIIRMGNNAGHQKISFRDYGNNEVGSIDSDGNLVLNGTANIDHNALNNIQGGTTDEYYHLLAAEYTELSNWLDNVTLESDGLTSVPEMVLIPRASALSDVVGGVYFSSIDKSVYCCTEI